MASNWSLCGVCDNRQITKPSEVWCSECDEGLCGDCMEIHSISRGTKTHETFFIAGYEKLPNKVLHTTQVCKLHNKKYVLFCIKHDCPCCKKCVKPHNDCASLTDINELIKNVKTSNAFYEIEETLLEVVENIKRIKTNRKDNLKSLKDKKIEIESEIKQTRTKINHHLDKLQDDLMKELLEVEQNESSKIEKLLSTLEQNEKEISEVQENIDNIKQHASELQTFLTMKEIEKDIAVIEKFIQSITTCDTTNQVNISCQINKSLYQNTVTVHRFGDINVKSDSSDFSIQKRKDRQAQIMVVLQNKYIKNLTLKLQKRITTTLSDVRGCSLLPGDKMVFSGNGQDRIRVLKFDGSKDFEMNKIGYSFDVVFIGDDSVAVTSGKSIRIIDLNKKNLKKSIQTNFSNYGVAYKDGHLICCTTKNGLQMISLSDESITNVSSINLPYCAYVTSFGDKLFYTNRDNHSVTCCDYHGKILWTFCDARVLEYPSGISVDNDGNVFVVGCLTTNVVVISPDGQRFRQLLSREDGLIVPQVLHYDTSTNTLLVANSKNDAFVYEVR